MLSDLGLSSSLKPNFFFFIVNLSLTHEEKNLLSSPGRWEASAGGGGAWAVNGRVGCRVPGTSLGLEWVPCA